MKKDTLYTVNKWNKNLFYPGGEVNNVNTSTTTPVTTNNVTNNATTPTTSGEAAGESKGSSFMSNMGGMDNMMQMGQQMDNMMTMLGNKVIAGGKTSTAGNVLNTIGKAVPGLGFIGGITNALFGSKLNDENINRFKNENTAYNKVTYGSDSSNEVLSNFASSGDLADINKKDVGSDGLFSNKAKRTTNGLNYDRQAANAHKQAALIQSADDLDTKTDSSLMANYSAYGGPVNKYGAGDTLNQNYNWWKDKGASQMFGAWGNPGQTDQARITRQSGYTNAASKFGGSNNAMAYAAAAQSIGNNLLNWKNEDYVKSNLGSNAGQGVSTMFGIADMLAKRKNNVPSLEEKIGLAYGGPVHKFSLGGSDYSQIAATAVNLANNFAVQADTKNIDGIENQIKRRGNNEFSGDTNDSLVNSWTNNYKAYNSDNITDYDLRNKTWAQDVINGVQAGVEGSTTGFQTGGIVGAIVGGLAGTGSSVAGSLIGRHRAKKKREALVNDIANANARQVQTFDVMKSNLDRSNDLNARALDYAYGGNLNKYTPGITYDIDDDEIQRLIDAGYQIQYE